MSAFRELFTFELRYQTRQPAFIVTALLLLLGGFLATASEDVQRARGITTLVNGPHAIVLTHLVLSIIAMFLVAHFVGRAATRDRSHGMDGLVLASPVSAQARLWGQLLGAGAVCALVFIAVSVGTLAGAYWPDISAEQRGPFSLAPYLWVYAVFVLPNLFFCAAMLFSLARVARSMMGMYLGLVAFFIAYEVSSMLLDNPALRSLAALLDPFGFSAFADATRFWTATEKNAQLVPFDGAIRLNRLLWFGVAMITLVLVSLFQNERREPRAKRTSRRSERTSRGRRSVTETNARPSILPPRWLQLRARTRLETVQLIGSPAFVILSILTGFMLIAGLTAGDGFYGTRSWPLTRMLSEMIQGAMGLLILIVIAYYTAESVWRERQTGIAPLIDATPVHNAILYLPKLISLWAVIAGLLIVGVVISVVYQTAMGYHHYEWSVYAQTLTLQYLLPAMWVAVLSLLIQILSPGKYVGMLLFAGFIVSSLVLPQLGFEHHLWRYSEGPEAIYSDMNGLGHFLPALVTYHVYWGSLAALLVLVGYRLWPRGAAASLKTRIRSFGLSPTSGSSLVPALLLLLFVAVGSLIFYNTNVLNAYRNADDALDWRADYERTLGQFERLRPPKITDVIVEVDLDPDARHIRAEGRYRLRNTTDQPISELLLSWAHGNAVDYDLPGSEVRTRYDALNASHLVLTEPMQPGETRDLSFTVERRNEGFRESEVDNRIAQNGTFINNQQLLPRLGYDTDQPLTDARQREERGLPEAAGMAETDDESQHWRTYLGPDVHYVSLDTTISTRSDQIALAPGRLIDEWEQGGRRYFHYRTERPVLNFFALLSAEYSVARERHNGVDIEIYHHPEHAMNVARMIEAVRHSLDYFGAEFSPYQYRQVRVIEFPRYETFAQSFANTIPYSEDIGFVADLRDEKTLDYVYQVTAHEMAHQWWGHQMAPANVRGGTVLTESLAQYSAYMLIRERYGEAYLRRFLKWELDRYLTGRGNEVDAEQVLVQTENKSYIHYQKGGLVLYALQDLMGTDRFHTVLRDLLAEFRDRDDRFVTTDDLMARLRAIDDAAAQAFITDSFERITLYDFELLSAVGRDIDAQTSEITITVAAQKSYFSGTGEESVAVLDEAVAVGLLTERPDAPMSVADVIEVQSKRLTSGENLLTISTDQRPAFVSIDPFLKRIDRDTENNTLSIEWEDATP